MRIIFFAGKGGVGKTSVAAATGIKASEMGHKTIIMSLDIAHSLSDIFDIGKDLLDFVDQGKLYAQIGNEDKIELNVMEEDTFAGSMFTGTFERNADDHVIGFSLDAGRVKNLKFVRKTQ